MKHSMEMVGRGTYLVELVDVEGVDFGETLAHL